MKLKDRVEPFTKKNLNVVRVGKNRISKKVNGGLKNRKL